MKQLKAIADSFGADFKSALAGSARVAHITVGQQKDPDDGTRCDVRDFPAYLVESDIG